MDGVRWADRHRVDPFVFFGVSFLCGLEIVVGVAPAIFDGRIIFFGGIGITNTVTGICGGCFVGFAFAFMVEFGGSGVKVIFEELGHFLEFKSVNNFDTIALGRVGHIGEVDLVEVAHEAFFFGAIDQAETDAYTKQRLAELADLAQEAFERGDGAALEVHQEVLAVHINSSGITEVTSAASFPVVGAIPTGVRAFGDQTTRSHAMAGVMHRLFDGGVGTESIVAKASRDGIVVAIGAKGHRAAKAEEDNLNGVVDIARHAVMEFAFGFVVTGGLIDTDDRVANELLFSKDLEAETLELSVLFHLFAKRRRSALFGACQFVASHL